MRCYGIRRCFYRRFRHNVLSQVELNDYFMRFISTKAHGVVDYLVSVILIASPWLFNFARGGAETWVPVILGVGAIVYSLLTNYEMGMSKTISMRTHLNMDLVSGIVLAASPWIFGFSEFVYMPHLIFGILEIGASLMTNPVPYHGNESATARSHKHAH